MNVYTHSKLVVSANHRTKNYVSNILKHALQKQPELYLLIDFKSRRMSFEIVIIFPITSSGPLICVAPLSLEFFNIEE